MSPNPWYAKGLAFSCTQCGRCCTSNGEYEHVYLAEADVDAISAWLGLSRRSFLRRHVKREDGWWMLRIEGPRCVFLTEEGQCSIYPVRPKQCATWPFWEENLVRERWEGPVKEICPGIGKGDLVPAEEVERIARETEEWYEED